MRRVGLSTAVLLGALILPAQAFAHAALRSTAPDFRQRLEQPPHEVVLRFDQAVSLPAITVVTAEGTIVSRPTVSLAGGTVITAPLTRLTRGAYTVRWHATSADSHTVSGVFTFGLRAEAPLPTEAYGSSGPTRIEHVVRWAYFLGLALLIGGLGMRLLVLRGLPVPRPLEQRLALVTGIGVVAVLEVGIVAFLLRAEDALQLPFGDLLYGDLSPISGGTRFGVAFVAMTLGYALVAALLFLAWLVDRLELSWAAFVIALGFASGLSLSGHSAVDRGSSWLSQLADWVHLAAASLWLGGLIALVACVWPLAPELRRPAFLRFSRVATVLVGLLVVAGVYLSLLRLPQLSDLWSASYGRVLLVKLSLVSVALLWGAFHHFVVRPALQRPGFRTGRMSRSLLGESMVGVAILLVAAVLVDSKPPAPSAPNGVEVAHVSR
jgi:copper transport protein